MTGEGRRRRPRLGYPLTSVISIDNCISMAIGLELFPKQKRPAGERCCEPIVYPDVEREQAARMADVAKALGEPVRLQPVDLLRKHAGKVCVCELAPCSRSPSPHFLTIWGSCARLESSIQSAGDCGPTTTSSPKR